MSQIYELYTLPYPSDQCFTLFMTSFLFQSITIGSPFSKYFFGLFFLIEILMNEDVVPQKANVQKYLRYSFDIKGEEN